MKEITTHPTKNTNWIIHEDIAGDIVIWRGEEAIATVWLNSETENIAKLIAAAPKLLEACREAESTIDLLLNNPKKYVSVASCKISLSKILQAINQATN